MRVSSALGAFLVVSSSTALESENTNSESSNAILRRNAEIEARLANGVYGVRKMSHDQGEKFFLEYWHFDDVVQGGLSERDLAEVNATAANEKSPVEDSGAGTSPVQFLARSFAFEPSFEAFFGSSETHLASRDFKCPTGTSACTSINRSDRCCSASDTCVIVTDTGSGDVGCCPSGQTCSGAIGSCQSGYTTCSQALGGGCCIPGYGCVEGGCKSNIPDREIFLTGLIDSK